MVIYSTWLLLPTKRVFVRVAVTCFLWFGKGKAFCERPIALHRQQPENDKHNVDAAPSGKISADAHGVRYHSQENSPGAGCRCLEQVNQWLSTFSLNVAKSRPASLLESALNILIQVDLHVLFFAVFHTNCWRFY